MKGLEGNKKEQAERLGMGLSIRRYDDDDELMTEVLSMQCSVLYSFFASLLALSLCSGVSHSVTSDMHIIKQESPHGAKTTRARRYNDEDDDEGHLNSGSDAVENSDFALGRYLHKKNEIVVYSDFHGTLS